MAAGVAAGERRAYHRSGRPRGAARPARSRCAQLPRTTVLVRQLRDDASPLWLRCPSHRSPSSYSDILVRLDEPRAAHSG
eukprot:6209667-Pleurochrysis_carterae.AAC.3